MKICVKTRFLYLHTLNSHQINKLSFIYYVDDFTIKEKVKINFLRKKYIVYKFSHYVNF